ncbi:MAG: hypothetical protein QGG36_03275 [Pirellulaceae bacterium]|nr:hypothetical protein [Pirellulaceae bacterium]MDP7014800.1 hypothetical protein [Pirellulaceae bacterium]
MSHVSRAPTEPTIDSARPRPRRDLRVTPQCCGEDRHVVIEDPREQRFHQVGELEYLFLTQLDGQTTIASAWRAVQRRDAHFDRERMQRFARWLVANKLLESASAGGETSPRSSRWRSHSPLLFRLPLGCPDKLLERIAPTVGAVFSRPGLFIWIALMFAAAVALAGDWSRFAAEARTIAGLDGWWLLPVCWLVLKLIHELGHGVACKRDGGEVRQVGVAFILFAPVFFIDVSSTWRFRSRWRRIRCAAAGMYLELGVAALASLAWCFVSPHTALSKCLAQLILMASVSTLLFNANPLMRFDGYYVLSDLLSAPNLHQHARRVLANGWDRVVFGFEPPVGMERLLPSWLLIAYGIASFAWRVFATSAICYGAVRVWGVFGAALALLSLVIWFGPAMRRFAQTCIFGKWGQTPQRWRLGLASALVSVAGVSLCLAPIGGLVSAPAIVVFEPRAEVRTTATGFVREVCVEADEEVQVGDVLMRVEDNDLQAKVIALQAEEAQLVLQRRRLQHSGRLGERAAVTAKLDAKRIELDEHQRRRERLTIRAARAGRFTLDDPASFLGKHVVDGDLLGHVVADDALELRIALKQSQVEQFKAQLGQSVRVTSAGWRPAAATLVALEPRATRKAASPALGAHVGGPIPVAATTVANDQVEYAGPRIHATARWSESSSAAAGLRCRVWLRRHRETLATGIARWLSAQLDAVSLF